MDIRLVAYRRNESGDDTYNVKEFELDLQKNPNVVVNYNWLDLKNPDKRKSSFSQTLKLPFTNRNNKFFENWFDVNLDTLVYNTKTKFEAILMIDSVVQLKGFIELKSIFLNARLYDIALFGDTANFFTDIKDSKLKDAFRTQSTTNPNVYLEDKQLDHNLTLANILASWTSPGLTTVLSTTTNDILYPIIDYGHTNNPYSSAMFWNPSDLWELNDMNGDVSQVLNDYGMVQASNLKPAIRIQRLFHIIAQKAGYQIKSSFMGINDTAVSPITDTSFFSRLFMTLSTESTRVKTLWNTSSGSEAPFVGFKATMSSEQTDLLLIGIPGLVMGMVDTFFDNFLVDTEVFDPNGLYNDNMQDWGVGGISGVNTPSIRVPDDNNDNALLPTGTIYVKTTFTINVVNQTNLGGPVNQVALRGKWFNQSTNTQVSNGTPFLINTNQDVTCEFTQALETSPGTIYYLVLETQPYATAVSTVTVSATIKSATIETEATDNVELMSGGLNGEVQMYHNMPDISQSDFVKDLINRFNLIISTDPDNEKLLLIEPYQDYISGGETKYYTDKLDNSREQVIKTTNQFQSKNLKFTDLRDDDILNQRYFEQHGLVYGQYKEFRQNDFAGQNFQNFSVMSPFIAQGIGNWQGTGINGAITNPNVAVAYCYKADENEPSQPMDSMKPKLFYYSGTPIDVSGTNPDTNTPYSFHLLSSQYLNNTTDALPTGNKFPLCLQYNLDTLGNITADTKILNWTYYSPAFNSGFTFNFFGGVYSTHGYYNDYWSQYINEIYSEEARVMDCYLYLTNEDIRLFTEKGFQNTYYIKNTLWRVINIQGHLVGGNKSTKVTLLKVIDKLTNDCGAIPTITNTGEITYVDAGTGLSTTINNNCCEEVNSSWTFVQTNDTTGEGTCYSEDPLSPLIQTPPDMLPMPSMLPNLETNYNILSTTGNANTTTFYLQAITINSTSEVNFSINGVSNNILIMPILSMSYVKISLIGSIMSGTNSSNCGYFEVDTVLVNRNGLNSFVGASGGTLLKTNKDSAFTTPTLKITNFDNATWKPAIQSGSNERINWIAKVEIIRQSLGDPDGDIVPSSKALFQNSAGILFQDLNNLEWN